MAALLSSERIQISMLEQSDDEITHSAMFSICLAPAVSIFLSHFEEMFEMPSRILRHI